MCLSRGCVDSQERHNAQVITMSDLTAAAADARIDVPQLIANLAAGAGIVAGGIPRQTDEAPEVVPVRARGRRAPARGAVATMVSPYQEVHDTEEPVINLTDPGRRGFGQVTEQAAKSLSPMPPPQSRPV